MRIEEGEEEEEKRIEDCLNGLVSILWWLDGL